MVDWQSVRSFVLCNAVSNLQFVESNGQMQERAVIYYSRALRGLSDSIGGVEPLESPNGVLISMMPLWFYGVSRWTSFI